MANENDEAMKERSELSFDRLLGIVDTSFLIKARTKSFFSAGFASVPIESLRGLSEVFGEGTIIESPCRDWFGRFKTSNTGLGDKPRRGRPSDFDDQATLVAVEVEESLITRTLADNFNVDHSTIVRRLKKLKKSICDCASGKEFFYKNYPLLVKFNLQMQDSRSLLAVSNYSNYSLKKRKVGKLEASWRKVHLNVEGQDRVLRQHVPLRLTHGLTSYTLYNPLRVLCVIVGENYSTLNPFSSSCNVIKENVLTR
uniref:Mos1 transposase HTH domain-containing protein n=1 Tax=Glossina austeni TaxID=7395 RepID=A0A1A9UGM4_GLOAU